MNSNVELNDLDDPFDLVRFYIAQEENYQQALQELQAGKKRTHWMWYVFPQMEGLAHSNMAHFYSIKSLAEAQAYIQHPLLSSRLIAVTEAVLCHQQKTLRDIFGKPDDKKFCSCMTLFSEVTKYPESKKIFQQAIQRFCHNQLDPNTLRILYPDSD